MNVKSYEAPTMMAALALVKEELGPNAYVLSTERKVKKGVFGLGAKEVFEVRAAADPNEGQSTDDFGKNSARKRQQETANRPEPTMRERQQAELEEDYKDLSRYLPYSAAQQAAPAEPVQRATALKSNPVRTPIEPAAAARPRTAESNYNRPVAPTQRENDELHQLTARINNIMASQKGAAARPAPLERTATRPTETAEIDNSPEATRLRASIAAAQRAATQPAAAPIVRPLPLTTNFAQLVEEQLIERGLDPEVAAIITRSQGSAANDTRPLNVVLQQAQDRLSQLFNTTQDDELMNGQVKAAIFLGPTGVGKTTTVAKLAARALLQFQRKVVLVTLDTYRIGAVKQLSIYADIIGVPLHVAKNATELSATLANAPADALVLIDTVGRNPYKLDDLNELAGYLAANAEVQKVLVTSATTSALDNLQVAARFQHFGINRNIITKVDETMRPGGMINQLVRSTTPLAYLTNGQNVPEDILAATHDEVGALLMGNLELSA